MKRFIFIWALTALVLASCGTVKTAANGEVELALTECEKYAEEMPGLRFAANGVSSDINRSRQAAEAAARNQLASAIASKCESALMSSGVEYTKTTATDQAAEASVHAHDLTSVFLKSASSMLVQDAPVVKSQRFQLKNGNYRTWVCIEMRQGLYNVAETMAAKVEQQLPANERLKINYDHDKFVKEIQEQLKKGY